MRRSSLPSCEIEILKSRLPAVRRRLLIWFDRNRRDLPWRRDRDPYRIWVSEVMLQQTQVATVVPYVELFMRAFPNVQSVAAASEQEVLRYWEGLGYYHRAKHFHEAARQLVDQNGGKLPDDPRVWQNLPGVGRYILGAVLSQAFDRRLPIVEANSRRVLCRLFAQRGDPKSATVKQWLWRTAEALLPMRRAGDFNQALMELGSQICTIASPKCDKCPLARHCITHREELHDTIPLRTAAPASSEIREVAVVVRKGKRVLLVKRPEQGRWAGMWEFPHAELRPNEPLKNGGRRILRELTGLRSSVDAELLTVKHTVTRFRITLAGLVGGYLGGKFRSSLYVAGKWILPEELKLYPVSSPQRKLAACLIE
jgi:A/G-specific adenine glycosylase